MGDWPRLVNLRRCARGYIFQAVTANNTTLALTNNSLGSELILLWQIRSDLSGAEELQSSYQQIAVMGATARAQAIVPGDAPPPGILSSGDQPTLFTPDWQSEDGWLTQPWPATFPFAALLPTWSIVFQNSSGSNNSIGVSLFWEAILPQYFDRMYSHRFIDVLIATQGG